MTSDLISVCLKVGLAGKDFIAKLRGWKKLEVLKKYLLSSGLDEAKVVAEYEFFK